MPKRYKSILSEVEKHNKIVFDLDGILGDITKNALTKKFFSSLQNYFFSSSKDNLHNVFDLTKIGLSSLEYFLGEDDYKLVEKFYDMDGTKYLKNLDLSKFFFLYAENFLKYLKRNHKVKIVSIIPDNGSLENYFRKMGVEFISNKISSKPLINNRNKKKFINDEKTIFISGPENGEYTIDHIIVANTFPRLPMKLRKFIRNNEKCKIISKKDWVDMLKYFKNYKDFL